MDENDFTTLIRDIELNSRQVSGIAPSLASRLIGNNASNASSADVLSQPSQVFHRNEPYFYQQSTPVNDFKGVMLNLCKISEIIAEALFYIF